MKVSLGYVMIAGFRSTMTAGQAGMALLFEMVSVWLILPSHSLINILRLPVTSSTPRIPTLSCTAKASYPIRTERLSDHYENSRAEVSSRRDTPIDPQLSAPYLVARDRGCLRRTENALFPMRVGATLRSHCTCQPKYNSTVLH